MGNISAGENNPAGADAAAGHASPPVGRGLYRQVPNLITIGRLVVTGLFFVLITVPAAPSQTVFRAWLSLLVFTLAVISDVLDGYLARSWRVESVFGRVVDPFADKILICGAFVFFSEPGWRAWPLPPAMAALHYSSTGIYAWMAVVLIAREFLVTGIRALAEGQGLDFRAQWAGKVKMVVQCAAIIAVILCPALGYELRPNNLQILLMVRNAAIWLTLAVTVLSAAQYIWLAKKLIHS